MENIPEREVRSSQGSADEESNAAFALAVGEALDDQTESWIWIRYGPVVYTQETEDEA